MTVQLATLESGAEIDPPWIVFPKSDPWNFKQGFNEAWMDEIWRPFWKRLTNEERLVYVEKYNAPSEWRYVLFKVWGRDRDDQRG